MTNQTEESGLDATGAITRVAAIQRQQSGSVNKAVKAYLKEIGQRGGKKSKRALSSEQARAMLEAKKAKNSFKIVERDDSLAVHSIGYHGAEGKARAQERIDNGYCIRHWMNKEAAFVVVPE